jgi:uncharacterized membrane protein
MNVAELHPAFVHFPVALTIIGLLCYFLGYAKWPEFQRIALVLLAFAFLFSFLSVFTGEKAAEVAKRIPTIEQALEKHKEFGEWTRWALGLAFIVGIVSQRVLKGSQTLAALFFLAYLFAAGFVGYTGYLGGELVLEYGAGFRSILSLSPLSFEEPPKGL